MGSSTEITFWAVGYANMHTKTETFDQHLFLSKSEAAIHYGSHYHRQRSFAAKCSASLSLSYNVHVIQVVCDLISLIHAEMVKPYEKYEA